MTTDNKTLAVDVLAVMDEVAEVLLDERRGSTAIRLERARAAVAELIEALAEVKQWSDVSGIDDEWPDVMERVNAALARVKGEAA